MFEMCTNEYIIQKYNVKFQGGIRKSNTHKCFVLVINDNVSKYSDTISEYQGEFIRGNKNQILKYGNKQLSECGPDWPLYVYAKKNPIGYEYLGEYVRNGAPVYRFVNDRWVYFFPIRKTYPFDSFEY